MGTPREKLIVCGRDSCSSVEALLDTGSDVTLLSEETAKKIGAAPLRETIPMSSATGHRFSARKAVVAGSLDGECDGIFIVGITDKKNLSGEDAIIGNDLMGQKCLKVEFEPKQPGIPQRVRSGCNCRQFFLPSKVGK